MGKFKRDLVPGSYLTAADMLSLLSQQQFKAAALQGRIVLAVAPPLAWLLDSCCVGRAAMQSTAPIPTPAASTSSSTGSTSSDTQLAAAVVAAAGVNTAGPELWEQYRRYQQKSWAAQQRKASRGKRVAAFAMAPPEFDHVDALQQMCLVQVSFQEAVFLSHVLGCCQIVAVGGGSAGLVGQDKGTLQQDGQEAGAEGTKMCAASAQQGSKVTAAVQEQQQRAAVKQLAGHELWHWCCRHTTGGAQVFAPQYAAYHHLRSLGWLPLPGLAYGADYVLYQLHPELAHSDFVVTVMVEGDARDASSPQHAAVSSLTAGAGAVTGASSQQQLGTRDAQQAEQQGSNQAAADRGTGSSMPSTQLAWLDACIMHRLARQVLKEMMLLYVVVPPGVSLADFDCIQHFQVREVLVQRWVPAEHREVK